jgi:hypothetical protein
MKAQNAMRRNRVGPAFCPAHFAGRIRAGQRAFTLLEVIVAFTVFFIFAFAVLEMTTRTLAAARVIQQREPDAGLVASMISLTNKLVEGTDSGDFEDLYPGMYPGWHWTSDVLEVSSNGLFRVQIVVHREARRGPAMTAMEIFLYRPLSPPGSATGGGRL